MRIAVISDIHANFYALLSVLDDMSYRNVDGIWCLGDIVGRGFQPTAVIGELMSLYNRQSPQHRRAWLAGNHDRLLLDYATLGFMGGEDAGSVTISGDNQFAIHTLQNNYNEIKNRLEMLTWLKHFPFYSQPHPAVYLAHAAYALDDDGNINEDDASRVYLIRDATITDMLSRMNGLKEIAAGLVMCGHTHISGAWRFSEGSAVRTDNTNFDLRGELVYINPGSVGFPRGEDTCPTYVILTTHDDFATLAIEWVIAPYNTDEIEYPPDYPDVYRREIQRCGR
jgi:predicted phosphodiesterase